MSTLTLKINNTDFSHIPGKYAYKTSYTPVYGKSYENLDKVKRVSVKRWRGGLEIDTRVLSEAQLTALYQVLATSPVTVKYHNFQLGVDVEQVMEFNADAFKDEFNSYRVGGKITFTQL